MKRILLYLVTGLISLAVILGIGVWGGMRLADLLDSPSSIPSRLAVRLESRYNSLLRTDSPREDTIVLPRVTLRRETVYLPLDAAHYAGGISAVGGRSVLIMDREGRFFHVADNAATQLGINPPDNHIAALQADLDAERFGKAYVDLKWFRYNDVLHVERDENDWLLASFTNWRTEEFCSVSSLARLALPKGSAPASWEAASDDWEIVAETAPCLAPREFGEAIRGLEAGGRLALIDGSRVVWTSGAYERDDAVDVDTLSDSIAQDDATDYGKVMEVDFLTGEMRHLAKGLRNPQGVAIDDTGDIWVTDHGMQGGDELNRVVEGANFGWPAVTYGVRYDGTPALKADRHANHDGYTQPAIAFTQGIAPGSLIAIDDFHYAWDGDMLIGAFRGALHRVHFENNRAIYDEVIEIGARPRDMVMLDDGRIAVWTDFRAMIFLSAIQDDGTDPLDAINARIAALDGDLSREVSATFEGCLQCHAFTEGIHGGGPSLHDVCGREPGTAEGYDGYSGALSAVGGVWSARRIADYIADPQAVAPGTNMAWGGIENTNVATAIGAAICGDPPS